MVEERERYQKAVERKGNWLKTETSEDQKPYLRQAKVGRNVKATRSEHQ